MSVTITYLAQSLRSCADMHSQQVSQPPGHPTIATISGSWLRWAAKGASVERPGNPLREPPRLSSWQFEATGLPVRSSAARKAHCAVMTTRFVAGFYHRLIDGRGYDRVSTRGWTPVGEFLVSMNQLQPAREGSPPTPAPCSPVSGLPRTRWPARRRGQSAFPWFTTVVEMQMRNDHCGDVGGCDARLRQERR